MTYTLELTTKIRSIDREKHTKIKGKGRYTVEERGETTLPRKKFNKIGKKKCKPIKIMYQINQIALFKQPTSIGTISKQHGGGFRGAMQTR